MKIKTIQHIETLDLNTLSKSELATLKSDLRTAFQITSSKDLLSDGRPAKETFGDQYTRVHMFYHDKFLI